MYENNKWKWYFDNPEIGNQKIVDRSSAAVRITTREEKNPKNNLDNDDIEFANFLAEYRTKHNRKDLETNLQNVMSDLLLITWANQYWVTPVY